MPNFIPDGITREDVLQAIADFDSGISHQFGPSTGYDLKFEGQKYPPKAILGLASRRAAGRTLTPEDFKGGEGSRCFRVLRSLDFEIESKQGYAVITENDESQWDDHTGRKYHFPKKYRRDLQPGTRVAYYKGGMKDRKYEEQRLHKDPHYFGFAVIGNVSLDPESSKGDLYADVEFFEMFDEAVLAKQNDEYIEQIPESKASNYWRNGVRPITFETYTKLRELSDTTDETEFTPITTEVAHPELFLEGTTRQVSVNGYERNRKARTRCLEIHGTSCLVCDVDLESIYGQVAQGFIHVHHNKELSEIGEEYEVDPEQDLSPVCPNCHAIIHRRKPSYSIDEVRGMLNRHS